MHGENRLLNGNHVHAAHDQNIPGSPPPYKQIITEPGYEANTYACLLGEASRGWSINGRE